MENETSSHSRGWKHANKKKYNKHKAAHIPATKPKNVLESNWDRYEQKPEDNVITSSTDFSVLANAPITYGSHFQFRNDKEFSLDCDSIKPSHLFNLDLSLLEKSLSTIPFGDRCGIDSLTNLTSLKDNVQSYEDYLKSYQSQELDEIFGSEEEELSDEETDLNFKQDTNIVEFESGNVKKSEECLEQWLDEILDD